MKRPLYDSNDRCTACKAHFDGACAPDCRRNEVTPARGQLAGRTLPPVGHTDTAGTYDDTTTG